LKYRISVITSVFNGGDFLPYFIQNAKSQTIFDDVEFIFVDANSDEKDKGLIDDFRASFPQNVKYIRESGCSIYEAWNIGVKNSSSSLLTNWNLDDRRFEDSLETQVCFMEMFPYIDFCYGLTIVSTEKNPNLENYKNKQNVLYFPCLDSSLENLLEVNSPHCLPVWRKSIHERWGLFNPDYSVAADYDMWLRVISGGGEGAKINNAVIGIYYQNPSGLSTGESGKKKGLEEVFSLRDLYGREIYLKKLLTWAPVYNENFHCLKGGEKEFWFATAKRFFAKDYWFFEGNLNVQGQMFWRERKALYETVRDLNPQSCIEIGTWSGGGSTYFIGRALSENGGVGRLYSSECNKEFFERSKKNIESMNEISGVVIPVFTCDIDELINIALKENSLIDFALLDGAEDSAQSLIQFERVSSIIPSGGQIAFHDWHTEKMKKVKEIIESSEDWELLTKLDPPISIGFRVYKKK
jgi:glycosyltransferase involved in cell wall biosynthesis